MSWEIETEEHSWLKEWYELKSEFRVKCRQVSCERKEILYVSIDTFKEHMEDKHKIIASYENDKFEIQYPDSNSWKYFMLWQEKQQPEDPQFAPEMAQHPIKCILCPKIIPCNDESARDKHVTKEHFDIENEYRERKFLDFWPWKYQTKLGLDFFVKCNLCPTCVTLELSIESLKKHYEENHKKIWERKFKQGEAHNQPGPSAGTSAGPPARPYQPRAKRTLQAEFEKHSWMKEGFEYLPNTHFIVKCRICMQEMQYVTIDNFERHMKIMHEAKFEFEEEKCKLHYDYNWTFFMLTNQGEIKCILCQKIVTGKTKNIHAENHKLNPSQLYCDYSIHFTNTRRSWAWKYAEHDGDYSVKCKLCELPLSLDSSTRYLIKHYRFHRLQLHQLEKRKKDREVILGQGEAHDQAGPSTQPLENREDRTLKSEFEKHSWLKNCYEDQSDLDFGVKCLVKTCQDRFRYVDITKFAEHMQTNHIKISELEDKKCSDVDVNWIYFMHKEQEEIECLICETIVTDESTDNHAQNHVSKDTLYFENCNNINRFNNIKENWVWKYQKRIGEYIVKCILCKEDSPKIYLTTNTTILQNHYKKKHIDKWNEIIKKDLKPEEMQEEAESPRKLKKTS